jgi:hypothetical protein
MYTEQNGRSFHERVKEHFNDYKYGNGKSSFAKYLLGKKHCLGSIENIMDVCITNKGIHKNTADKFDIYKETKLNIK